MTRGLLPKPVAPCSVTVSICIARRILRENVADSLTDYSASPKQLVLPLGPIQCKAIELLQLAADDDVDMTDGQYLHSKENFKGEYS